MASARFVIERIMISGCAVVLASLVFSGIGFADVLSPWPMAFHDAQQTSRSDSCGPYGAFVPKWKFKVGEHRPSNPVIDAQGTIYVVSSSDSGRSLIAVNPDGTERWHFGSGYAGSPAIGSDGTIYVAKSDGLDAVASNGMLAWSYGMQSDDEVSAPTLGPDGTIYVSSTIESDPTVGMIVHAVNVDGSEKWQCESSIRNTYPWWVDTVASSVLGHNGLLYSYVQLRGGPGDYELLWCSIDLGTGLLVYKGFVTDTVSPWGAPSISIGPDGTIYVGDAYQINAYNPDFSSKWTRSFDNTLHEDWSPPIRIAVSKQGELYFGCEKWLYGLLPDATDKWPRIPLSFKADQTLMGGDGLLYNVRAIIESETGQSRGSAKGPSSVGQLRAIGFEKSLYSTTEDGYLCAFYEGYTISGKVTLHSTTRSVQDVKVVASGSISKVVHPDAEGTFIFEHIPEGNITLTPTLDRYKFTPAHYGYSPLQEDKKGQDFSGKQAYVEIRGKVMTCNSKGIPDVTVRFGRLEPPVKTHRNGSFSREVPLHWSGTVTFFKEGYEINPRSKSFHDVITPKSLKPVIAERIAIAGKVTTRRGAPVAGVTIEFNNGGGAVRTDSRGDYTKFVDCSWSGSVKASQRGDTFIPVERSYQNIEQFMEHQNYTRK